MSEASPEADAVAEQMAERAARIGQRRFHRSDGIEPGAQDSGDGAVETGDRGEERRPQLERGIFRFAVVDRRVVAQDGPVEPAGDVAGAQIGLGRRAGNGSAGTEEATGHFRGSARCGGC
jgi:hypothetical protein